MHFDVKNRLFLIWVSAADVFGVKYLYQVSISRKLRTSRPMASMCSSKKFVSNYAASQERIGQAHVKVDFFFRGKSKFKSTQTRLDAVHCNTKQKPFLGFWCRDSRNFNIIRFFFMYTLDHTWRHYPLHYCHPQTCNSWVPDKNVNFRRSRNSPLCKFFNLSAKRLLKAFSLLLIRAGYQQSRWRTDSTFSSFLQSQQQTLICLA